MTARIACLVVATLIGGLAPPGSGQDAGKSPPGEKTEAQVAFEAISSEYDAAMAAYQAAARKVQASEEYKKAREARDMEAIRALMADLSPPNAQPMVERAMEVAGRVPGQAGTAELLNWAISRTRQNDVRQSAIDMLLDQHAESEAILPFAEGLPRMARVLGVDGLAKIKAKLDGNPSKAVRANAMYAWAQAVNADQGASEEEKAAAAAATQEAAAMVPGTILAYRIQGPEFEKTRLQIGMEAPDIEGRDLDGVDFKLSDYRGKVVVLDFWGDW